jgi:DNA-binding NarL/FixJ family response regulator
LATTGDLDCLSGRDIRLVALDIGDRAIADPSIEDDLALLAVFCPNAFVALLSNRDDEGTAMAAMQRGVRGFFPTSIPVEVAIAGLRLVLAGGIYRPLPATRQDAMPYLAYSASPELPAIHDTNGVKQDAAAKTVSDFTPPAHYAEVFGA